MAADLILGVADWKLAALGQRPEAPDSRLEEFDLRLGEPGWKFEELGLRLGKPGLRLEEPDLRLGEADRKSERLDWTPVALDLKSVVADLPV